MPVNVYSIFLSPYRVVRCIILSPIILLLLWRLYHKRGTRDWGAIISITNIISKIGKIQSIDIVWAGYAYSNLHKWKEALHQYEKIVVPCESLEEESWRYCLHAYALAKVGRYVEANNLLRQSITDDWPDSYTQWSNQFFEFIVHENYVFQGFGTTDIVVH